MSSYYDKAEYVLAIAEEGNISRAAEKLFVSQSTLTMFLNRLEEEFGSPLFDRTVRPIVPTKAGTLYINDLLAVRRMEQTFWANLRHLRNPNETLNIGIGPIRSKLYMPKLLSRLREIYPDISVNLTELSDDNLPRGLLQGRHDVIFGCFAPSELLAVEVIPVGEEAMGIIAPRSFRLQGDAPAGTPKTPLPIPIQRLKHLPIIIPGPGSDLHNAIVDLLNRHAVEPDSVIMTQSTATAIGLVAEGAGYAFVEYPFLGGARPDLLERIDYFSLADMEQPVKHVVACYSKNSIKQETVKEAIGLFQDIFYKLSFNS